MNPELAAAASLMSGYFVEKARQAENLDSPLVVQHHSDDAVARAYVRMLGDLTKKLFGSVLRNTIATTASIALQREVTEWQVRNWMKS